MLTYNTAHKLFVWQGDPELAEQAGFKWSPAGGCWYTPIAYIAYKLKDYLPNVVQDPAADALIRIHRNIVASNEEESLLGVQAPDGLSYYPFQEAGIERMADQLKHHRGAVLCADEQGLGKTIQAIGVANEIGARCIQVDCPASLRLNWARELRTWHKHNPGTVCLLKGDDRPIAGKSVITSYNLAAITKGFRPDLMIIDETHYLKNYESGRTKLHLGGEDGWRGLVDKTPTIFLSGTPLPNGRPNELWPLLYRCAPDVIDGLGHLSFVKKYCEFFMEDGDIVVTGAKNHKELYVRLRGSGFMTRRLKKNVLKDLPPKRYKMVVFPLDARTYRIVQKEQQFNAQEIIEQGIPEGSALPELRREMGIAKLQNSLAYIKNMLDGGTEKLVVFGHHKEVMASLEDALLDYNPVSVVGGTPQALRQSNVDAFQNDPTVRVILGSEAMEEGWTLTAAHDIVAVEPEWVPGKNEQRPDRLHRIGQTQGVIMHILVVERSLDAKILSSAAFKAEDANLILNTGGEHGHR